MKQRSEQDIVFFISAVLGVLGAGMLLIPERFHSDIVSLNAVQRALAGVGIYAFSLFSLSSIFMAFPGRVKQATRLAGVFILWVSAGACALDGTIVLSLILFSCGLLVLAIETPLAAHVFKAGGTNILGMLINVSVLVFLYGFEESPAIPQFTERNRDLLMWVLSCAVLAGLIHPFLKSGLLKKILKRIHAVPWAIWFVLLLPGGVTVEGGLAFFLALALAGTGAIPWDKLEIAEQDVLGRRVLMIGNTLLLTLLIFLGTLLFVTDQVRDATLLLSIRDSTMLFFSIVTAVIYYEIATIIMTLNGLVRELENDAEAGEIPEPRDYLINWNDRLARYLKPYVQKRHGFLSQIRTQANRLQTLSAQIELEKKRNIQMNMLNELNQQMEEQMDLPVSAQLAVNTLERALNSPLVRLYLHEPDSHEFMLLAAAGEQKFMLPSGYRQNADEGALGRTARQRKTQVIHNIDEDRDYIRFDREKNLSCVIVPMIYNGHVKGMLTVNSEHENAFGSVEVSAAESVADSLLRAWARSSYHERLKNLIQAGSQLSAALEPATTASEVAAIARETLDARFTYIQLKLGQEGNFYQTAVSGNAPNLLAALKNESAGELIQTTFRAETPFRVRDIRKYPLTAGLNIDHTSLRSMIATPIRWHRVNIGILLAFGKNQEVFFTESDESIAEMLALQAAGAFESAWLQQELRASLRTTSLLYRLSTNIIQAETLQDAAQNIASTAHKLSKGIKTGIVLFSAQGHEEASIIIDPLGSHMEHDHPMDTIQQVMSSGQMIYMSQGQSISHVCVPIQTHMQKYGALWTNMPDSHGQSPVNPADLQTLANQAAVALERSMLLVESRRQAEEIKAAYHKLESTYDQTLAALISALDARDQETEGHSLRVGSLATRLGDALGFTQEQIKLLERGSLLHDIGKIGISDVILHKPGPLTDDEWRIMKMHPEIGARIVEKIPFLEDTIPLILHHQERWDGTGYPDGLSGEQIPLLARMFSIVDAFDALTSKRPYRQSISAEEALAYLEEQAGILFDPQIVSVFKKVIQEEPLKQVLGESAHEHH